MARFYFTKYAERSIMYVDATGASTVDQEELALRVGTFLELYRKEDPLLVLYDVRGLKLSPEMLAYVNKHLIKNMKKVFRRAFMVDDPVLESTITKILTKRHAIKFSFIGKDLIKALNFLVTGKLL